MSIREQMRKGTTTVILLNLLAELDRPMYGYEIIQELELRSEGYFRFKEGLIYPRLHELERQGLLRAEWQGQEGRRRLERELQGWRAFTRHVNRILGLERTA